MVHKKRKPSGRHPDGLLKEKPKPTKTKRKPGKNEPRDLFSGVILPFFDGKNNVGGGIR